MYIGICTAIASLGLTCSLVIAMNLSYYAHDEGECHMLYRMLYTVCRMPYSVYGTVCYMLYVACCMMYRMLYAVPNAVHCMPARCPLSAYMLSAAHCTPALADGTRWPRSIGSLIHSLGTSRLIMSRSSTGIGKHISYYD